MASAFRVTNVPRALAFALIVSVLVTIVALFAVSSLRSNVDGPLTNPTDFRAFYCGGWTLLRGADPYVVQPLMGCQQRAVALFGLRMLPNLVLPAPLPPYALALFAAIAFIPYPLASLLWFSILVVALVATVVVVHRLSGVRLLYVALALVGADGFASLVIGQIVPVVVFAICAGALALRSRRHGLAAGCLALAMIEPHLGLPAALAVFVLRPAARLPIVFAASVIGVLSLAVGGLGGNLEYLRDVLPAHARSEVTGFGAQYSLTAFLYAFGVGETASIRIGELSYALTVVAGIALAGRLARRYDDPAFLVVTAPALAVFGGVFIHIQQMAVALPFALMLVPRVAHARFFAIAAVVALAIPWQSLAEMPAFANRPGTAGWHAPKIAAPSPTALAEEPEMEYIRAGGTYPDARSTAEMVLWKMPTWLALVALAAIGYTVSPRRPISVSAQR